MRPSGPKTAKPLPDTESVIERSSISVCVIGVRQTGKNPESTHVNGATGRLQMERQRKLPRCEQQNLKRPSVIKTGAESKCLKPTADTNATAAERLNECFCRLTTSTMMGPRNEDQASTTVEGQPSTIGFARTSSRKATKCCV